MYLLFKYNKITKPSKFKKLKKGEKIILAALIEKQIEEEIEIQKTIENSLK